MIKEGAEITEIWELERLSGLLLYVSDFMTSPAALFALVYTIAEETTFPFSIGL